MLRNGLYKDMIRLNVIQALATLCVVWLMHDHTVAGALAMVGLVRVLVAAMSLSPMARIVPVRTFLFPLNVGLISLVALLTGSLWTLVFPTPTIGRLFLGLATYGAVAYGGLRFVLARDADTLDLIWRLIGQRFRFVRVLLPPPVVAQNAT